MTSPWHHSFRYNYMLSFKVLWAFIVCFGFLDKSHRGQRYNLFLQRTVSQGVRCTTKHLIIIIKIIYSTHTNQTGAQGTLHYYPCSSGGINRSWNHVSSLGTIQLDCCHFGAYRANQTQQPTLPSQVPIYSWVERSNYDKVSCSRTQASWSQPGFKPTFWQLGHQNTNPMTSVADLIEQCVWIITTWRTSFNVIYTLTLSIPKKPISNRVVMHDAFITRTSVVYDHRLAGVKQTL